MKSFDVGAVVVASLLALSTMSVAHASPINITATLLGDARAANPDGLKVNVKITGDTTSNKVTWLVDLDMAATHPNVKLGEFDFNMVGIFGDYSFSNFSPTAWSIVASDGLQGSGNMNFIFEANDPTGNSNNVTNAVDLSFDMTKASGNFSASDFLNAAYGDSSNPALPNSQLGAHLQSLTPLGGATSGVALGNYANGGGSGPGGDPIPEPATLALVGLGLFAAASTRRLTARRFQA